MMMVLCLGPTGSGKSLLLKKLQNSESVDETTSSVPTVGTNIFTMRIDNDNSTETTTAVQVRELGGVMAPLWSKYYAGIGKIIYVVDASNLCQISAAAVLLYTVLANPLLRDAKILLVLSKMDLSYRQMRNEALLMLQMKRFTEETRQKITITESSAITGLGRDEILQWLKK